VCVCVCVCVYTMAMKGLRFSADFMKEINIYEIRPPSVVRESICSRLKEH